MARALAVAIAVWTGIAWGGRIGLLAAGENGWAWLRIAGSIFIGLLAFVVLVTPRLEWGRRPVLALFAVWTTVLWARSLVVNWAGTGSLPFKLVHTVLAAGFLALAAWAAREAIRSRAMAGGGS